MPESRAETPHRRLNPCEFSQNRSEAFTTMIFDGNRGIWKLPSPITCVLVFITTFLSSVWKNNRRALAKTACQRRPIELDTACSSRTSGPPARFPAARLACNREFFSSGFFSMNDHGGRVPCLATWCKLYILNDARTTILLQPRNTRVILAK